MTIKFLKKIFSRKLIIFSLVFVFSLGIFLRGGTQVKASFMQSVGINTGTTGKSNTNTWLQFAQSVNSDQTNVISWSGFPLVAMMNHLTAFIFGYPDANGNIIPRTGALSSLSGLMGYMYTNQPSSSQTYLASVVQNIGLSSSPAYAAGPGTAFFPQRILEMWQQVRNLAYVFMVIVVVAIGFMIMFRFKINPQTVATVQDSLPKIAVSLILMALSYALVGLMVDIAFVGNALIQNVILNNLGLGTVQFDIFFLAGHFGGSGPNNDFFAYIGKGLINLLQFNSLNGLILLIVAFSTVSSTIKIFFALLSKYVTIIMGAIFAPLAILWGTLPGQEDTFPKMLKGLASAALAFPAVVLFLSLASYFASNSFFNPGGAGVAPAGQQFNDLPPFSAPIVAGQPVFALNLLVALGILMATANIPQIIDDALAVKPSGIGAGAGESAGFLRRIPIVGSFLG